MERAKPWPWMGAILLVGAMAVLASVPDLCTCPSCSGTGIGGYSFTVSDDDAVSPTVTVPCHRCKSTGRLSASELFFRQIENGVRSLERWAKK
jgi:hypothetical protein